MSGSALVTGAGSYIGRQLARHLISRGIDVVGTDHPFAVPPHGLAEGMKFIPSDLENAASLRRLFTHANYDFLFHTAARSEGDDAALQRVNVEGTTHLLNASLQQLIPAIVFISTTAVYGPLLDLPATEQHPKRPRTPYTRSRLAQEEVGRTFWEEQRIPITILRPAMVYGPGDDRYLGAVITALLNGELRSIPGRGCVRTSHVHIDDLCAAAYFLAKTAGTEGEAYHIADDTPLTKERTLWTLALSLGVAPPRRHIPKWLAKLMCMSPHSRYLANGWAALRHPEVLRSYFSDYIYSNEKIGSLGYRVQHASFIDAAPQLAAWYQQHADDTRPSRAVLSERERSAFMAKFACKFGEPYRP